MKRANQFGYRAHRDRLVWSLLRFVENQKQLRGVGHAGMWTITPKPFSMPSPEPTSVGTTTTKPSNLKLPNASLKQTNSHGAISDGEQ